MCAYVVKGNRFCRSASAYRIGGKTYCGRHAPLVGAVERMLRERRSLYAQGLAHRNGQDSAIDINEGQDSTVTSGLIVEAKEFDLPDEGLHPAKVKKVELGPAGQFGPTFRWTYEITEGEWSGREIDELTGRDMTPNAKASMRYKAATGEAVEPGQRYDLGVCVERPVQIMVKHKESAKGGIWPQISDVLAPAKKRQPAASRGDLASIAPGSNGRPETRPSQPATEPQIKAIYAIGLGALRLDEAEVDSKCEELFGCTPAELSRRQAAEFIDALKAETPDDDDDLADA